MTMTTPAAPVPILIVDDDELSLEMLKCALEEKQYQVYTAANGREALAVLHREPVRLVITDWVMPQMSGVDLIRAVRAEGFDRYVYMILLTSHDHSHAVAGLEAGADDFLTKPFDPAELTVRVRAAQRVLSLETRDVTIFALAKLAESRDPETGAHLERVQNYSRVLAQHLALRDEYAGQVDAEYVNLVYATSPLHDIGKVAIPDCVLLKPGRLTEREYEIMKTHTTAGAATLENAMQRYPGARFLEVARDIALYHHERWDGQGYPHGLRGDETPVCARIAAVADVYDALVSKRVYKESFSTDVARAILVDERGTQFDPDVVDAFLAHEEEFLDIQRTFSNEEAVLKL